MNFTRLLAVSALVLTLPSILLADPFGIDTFEDGTTQGWFVPGPHPVPPANIASGGPNGAGDNYLQVTALGGDGAGSRLSVQNISQWTGSFAHLSSVTMDEIGRASCRERV